MATSAPETISLSLPRELAEALLALRACPDEAWTDILRTALESSTKSPTDADAQTVLDSPRPPPTRRYEADFLGTRVTAWTLPEIFAQIIDLTSEVAPEALETLTTMRARTRRYAAPRPELIHSGRRDLAVLRTKSGWWISKNIGKEDLMRGLRALALASGLTYGSDLSFRLR